MGKSSIVITNVIQSEAKDLGNIHVNASEILRHYVPLNDKNFLICYT